MDWSRPRPEVRLTCLVLLLLLAGALAEAEPPDPSTVVILANSADRDSLNLAAHYARTRKIPAKNIIHLRMPRAEEVSWDQFSGTLLNPLRQILIDRELLGGRFRSETDAFGRRKFIPLDNSVEYLVLCRGVPLKLKNELSKVQADELARTPSNYRTTGSSVDAELALLASENQAGLGWVHNPLFKKNNPGPFTRKLVVKVARLDGPTHESALRLVDSAQAGELAARGRAYVDAGGPHRQGNDWMDSVRARLEDEGYEVGHESTSALFNEGQRFDAPLLYFGWHSYHVQGPFARTDLTFPAGALAFHIHSFSAQSLRTDNRHWVGPLVKQGVTATIGNVSEPYLHLTHHLPVLLEQLLDGKCLADAAYASLPALSWQAILVGDPLYKPNWIPPTLKPAQSPFHIEQYSTMKTVRRLAQSGQTAEALNLGRTHLQQAYGIPLAITLAEITAQQGQSPAIGQLLAPAVRVQASGFQQAGALLQAALILKRAGFKRESDQIRSNLRRIRNLPAALLQQLQ